MSFYLTGFYDKHNIDKDAIHRAAMEKAQENDPMAIHREEVDLYGSVVAEIMKLKSGERLTDIKPNEDRMITVCVFFLIDQYKRVQIASMLNISVERIYEVDLPRIKRAVLNAGVIKEEELSKQHRIYNEQQLTK